MMTREAWAEMKKETTTKTCMMLGAESVVRNSSGCNCHISFFLTFINYIVLTYIIIIIIELYIIIMCTLLFINIYLLWPALCTVKA